MYNYLKILFKDFVILAKGEKIPRFGESKYGNIEITEDIKNISDLGGILQDNIILIDLDDEREGQLLLNLVKQEQIRTIVIKTDRGYHFYFKNNEKVKNRSKIITALGLSIDIKSTYGNKIAYAVIKRNGKFRDVVYGENLEDLDFIPYYLKEIRIKDTSKIRKMDELRDGDGRNDYLHNFWKFILFKNNFTQEQTRETLFLINDYILKEPLSEREIETIAREEDIAIKKTVEIKSKKDLKKEYLLNLAKKLIEKYNIVRLESSQTDDLLYYYVDNHYKLFNNDSVRCNLIIQESLNDGEILIKSDLETVVMYIKAFTRRILKDSLEKQKESYIATNNKLIVFNENGTFEIKEPSSGYFCTTKINIDYNENAEDEGIEDFLKDIADWNKDTENLLKELIGYCLFPRNILRKAFFLIGNGGNGKSTFLNLLSSFLGSENTANINLNDIENNRFSTANLKDKLVNLGDDINADSFDNLSNFKTITSGDMISAEFKGGQAFSFKPFCKLIYTANIAPRFNEISEGIKSRVIFIPFNKRFIKNNRIQQLNYFEKLNTKQNREYLLQLGLKSLMELLNRGYFLESEEVKKLTEENLRESDSVYSFLLDFESQNRTVYNEPVRDVFNQYLRYCRNCNINTKTISINNFSKRVRSFYSNLVTEKKFINNKTRSIFYGTTEQEFSLLENLD